jgi:signal transduction histidine kinase
MAVKTQTRGRSLQWRIIVRLLPLLAAVFAAAMFFLGWSLKRTLYQINLDCVRRSSVSSVLSIEAAMSAAQDGHPWNRLAERIAPRESAWIRVIAADGRLLFPADLEETRPRLDLDDPSCSICHSKSPGPIPDAAILPGPADDSYQLVATPLLNREWCRSCHGSREAKLGVVLVGRSVEPIHAMVRTAQLGIAAAGGIAFLLTLLVMRMVLGRMLGRPMRTLVAGARSIAAGDRPKPIELGEWTELSVLAEALNSSTARLTDMVRRVESQRDEFATLYRFTDQLSRTIRPEERRLRAVELATQFLGAECVFIQASFLPETQSGAGTITMRSAGEFEDHRFSFGPESQEAVPTFLREVVQNWLSGEYDEKEKIEEGWLVGYPVEREGRHLGLLLLPAPRGEDPDAEAPDDDLVRALCRHIATALEFSEMQSELVEQARLAAVGETIAGLAHCLKNALNGLRAGQFITDRGVVKKDRDKLRRGWSITKEGIRQVEGIALDMLYYVRERKPARTEVDPNSVLKEVVDLLQEMAAARGVRLETEIDEDVGKESLDRTAIYRALLNLATNAIDACTESESGDLVILRTRREQREIVLTVEDNGIGMSDEVRSRLFSRFFSTKPGKGTGLGLMVVKKIVEEHGGGLTVESEPGRGSSFLIRLPRQEA